MIANLKEITLKMTKTAFKTEQIKTSWQAAQYMRNFFSDDIELYESFFLLLLNKARKTIGYVKISQGGCTGTVADPKLIAKYAIESLAEYVIICHNHPSGNVSPSTADIQVTKKIKDTLKIFDCELMEHIILTADSYYSFADNGDLY